MGLNKYVFAVGAGLSLLILAGCTQEKTKIIEAKQAPAEMTMSFTKAKTCEQVSCITIQKDSLSKIFLLIASGKTGGSTPQWYDLKPQVVSFERSGAKIGLLGQNYNSIYKEIQTVNLIQSFAIITEDAKTITFDLGDGFKSFISQSSYDVDAVRGTNSDLTETSVSSIPVSDSFIRNIKFDDKNIELEQISKVRSSAIKIDSTKSNASVDTREETLTMNVQIRSYNLDPSFKPKEYDASRRVGFFVSKIGKKGYSKEVSNLISKWDLSPSRGPIRIRVSASVPEDYVQAVTEGALYWNLVFGREVVKVETGVEIKDANPEDRSIMIRWIDWLDAGAAYAISQSDPLTGEILRAQVFMPSVFTKVGSADLVDLNGKVPVVVNGAVACDFSQAVKDLKKISREATDSQRLRLAQDSVRATVAHELGHAFGLRHNFAGSYSSKVSIEQIAEASKNYLKDKNSQGLETTTSIMDYVGGIDNILSSARIKFAPLSYDKMAMDWAYSDGDAALDASISKYCTDDDIALGNSQNLSVYGCERFDAGNNPLLRKYLDAKDEKENFVNVLFASIIGRMYPGDQPDVVNNVDQVIKDTVKWVKVDMSSLAFVNQVLFDSFTDGAPSGAMASLQFVQEGKVLYSKFGQDTPLKLIRAKDLAAAGGYAGMLNGLLRGPNGSLNMNWVESQVDALIASGYLEKGKTLSGREYALTTEQQTKIVSFFKMLIKINAKTVYAGIQAILPKINEVVQQSDGSSGKVMSILSAGLVDKEQAYALSQLSLDLLLENSGEAIAKVGADKKAISVPVRFLTTEERLSSLKLLSNTGLSFGQDLNKAQVKGALTALVNEFLKLAGAGDLSVVPDDVKKNLANDLLSRGLIDTVGSAWLAGEMTVLLAIDAVK